MAGSSCFDSSLQKKVQPEVDMPYGHHSFSLLLDMHPVSIAPILFFFSTSPAVLQNVSNPADPYQY